MTILSYYLIKNFHINKVKNKKKCFNINNFDSKMLLIIL